MLLVLLLLLLTQALRLKGGPIVNISSGAIEGFTANSTDGIPFHAFLSIPYAQPPVGPLRFQAPQTFGQWQGVRNGSEVGPKCPQMDFSSGGTQGDEDCLYLNVYIPQINGNKKLLPVIFYIQGGGFSYGSGTYSEYGPQLWMNFPIVLVTINHRLGPLGFLSTNDSNAYGNYAMMDQVMALKWVQKNIRYFGGDPKKVTLLGSSSGAASVTFHLISKLSKGLISRGIAESAAATAHWAVNSDPLQTAKQLAELLSCQVDDSVKLVQCLRSKNASEIVLAANKLQTAAYFPIIWAPVVEVGGGPGFLTQMPRQLFKSNQIYNRVPFIIGQTALEGYNLYANLKPSFKYSGFEYFEKQFPFDLPLFTSIQPNMSIVIDAIVNEYCHECDLDNETVFTLVLSQIIGDAMMVSAIVETTQLLSECGLPTYAYVYTHVSQNCIAALSGAPCGLYASHGDEVFILFKYLTFTQALNEADRQMSRLLASFFVNFASRANLVIDKGQTWPLYHPKTSKYAVLSVTPSIQHGSLSSKEAFWNQIIPSLIKKYY